MASIYTRPGSPYFWMSKLLPNGKRKCESTKIRLDAPGGKRSAEVKAHIESAKETNIPRAANGTQLLKVWVPQFLKERYEVRQPKTYLRYTEAWTALRIFLDDRAALTAGQVTRHLAKKYPLWRIRRGNGLKPVKWNTALFELKVLGSILQDAVERDEITGNPIFRLGLKREPTKEKQPFTREDQSTVEAKLKELEQPDWMHVSWKIAMLQGCRISETSVPLHRVDLESQPPTITFLTKGGKFHIAPLHAELIPMLQELKRAKAKVTCTLPPNAARTWHNFLHRTLGFEQYSFHCTRVTVVTRLAIANFSQPRIKDYVGHASTTVNDVYRKLRPRDLVAMGSALGAEGAVMAET